MQMRTKLPIAFLVGAGALLLVALAVIFTFRAQTAFAQDPPPSVEIDPEQQCRDQRCHMASLWHSTPSMILRA